MAASTPALPPLTCTARGQPTSAAAVVVCCKAGHLWPCVLRPVPGGESAGCVRLQWLFCGLCACCRLCLPCPLPSSSCPRSVCLVLCPLHCAFPPFIPCAPGSPFSRASSLFVSQGQQFASYGLSRWQLQHGPAVAARAPVHLTLFFFLQSPFDPGPWE